MTYLELIAEVGSGPLEVVRMYLRGTLSGKELKNVLGAKKAETVEKYIQEQLIFTGQAQLACSMEIQKNEGKSRR